MVLWADLVIQVWGIGLILSVENWIRDDWSKQDKFSRKPLVQYVFSVALKTVLWILHLLTFIFASLASSQLVCLQASGYYILQIQSAFKCTRIYYPIWKIIQASRTVLIQREWTELIHISKLDQLIISPKATLKSKLDTVGDFICSFLGCLRWEIYCSYSGGQNSPLCTLFPISLTCVINIFFLCSLNAVLLI